MHFFNKLKININEKGCTRAFIVTSIGLFLAYMFYIPKIGSRPEVFWDLIIELLAFSGGNKSGELAAFWNILLLSILVFFALSFLLSNTTEYRIVSKLQMTQEKGFYLVLLVANGMYLAYYGKIQGTLLGILLYFFLLDKIFKEQAKKCFLFTLTAYYGLLGIYAATNLLMVTGEVSTLFFKIVVLILTFFISLYSFKMGKRDWLDKGLWYSQFAVPLLLCVFLVNRYSYRGTIVSVAYSPIYVLIVFGIMVWMYIKLVKESYSREKDKQRSYSIISAISVFCFNSALSPARFVQMDSWHHGEQMLAWQQVVEQGQKLYDGYSPSAGIFPMVEGFVQNILLGGAVTEYPQAMVVVMLAFSILIILLCNQHVGIVWTLLFAVVFRLHPYNRMYFVLPILLTLSLPKVIKNRERWLFLYVMLGFMAGLYYPIYGLALICGWAPLAILQIVSVIKENKWKLSLHNLWKWIVLMIVLLCSTPLLYRMAKHILLYSSQTVLADGQALFGNTIPDSFVPYMNPALREVLICALRFWIPAFAVVSLTYIGILYIRHRFKEFKSDIGFFMLLSGVITLLISYSMTLVREGTFFLWQTGLLLFYVMGMYLAIFLKNYWGNVFVNNRYVICLSGILLGAMLIIYPVDATATTIEHTVNVEILGNDSERIVSSWKVPDDFVLIDDSMQEQFSRIGEGFVSEGVYYGWINQELWLRSLKIREQNIRISTNGDQITPYVLNYKVATLGSPTTSKSYEAQKALVASWKNELPIIQYINPIRNYYLFNWMVRHQYKYDDRYGVGVYYPPDMYERYFGNAASENTDYNFMENCESLRNTCNSLGNSILSMSEIMSDRDEYIESISWNDEMITIGEHEKCLNGSKMDIDFTTPTNGNNVDFLYVELKKHNDVLNDNYLISDKTKDSMVISLGRKNSQGEVQLLENSEFYFGDGKLLIPIGMWGEWLISDNQGVVLMFNEGFETEIDMQIKEIHAYKLREIE